MLLELHNIKKYYPVSKGFWRGRPAPVRAVDDVSLSMAAGENLGLVGESGCGKTTLGRAILKLVEINAGQIIFNDQDITRLSGARLRPVRRHLQMVFQDPFNSLDPRFTVRNILQEAMLFDSRKNRSEDFEKMKGILNSVNLPEDVLIRYPHEFSGGERQRIAIARALIPNPKLLVLDEAVSSLDVLVQEQIIQLLKGLQEKFSMTYLFISHNMRVVKKLCPRLAVMYRGKIVEVGPTAEIFENPLHPYTCGLLSAALHYKTLEGIPVVDIDRNAQLHDKGNNHWVLE